MPAAAAIARESRLPRISTQPVEVVMGTMKVVRYLATAKLRPGKHCHGRTHARQTAEHICGE